MELLERHAGKIRLLSIFVVLVGVFLVVRALPVGELNEALERWIEGVGFWAPVVFGVIYVAATVLLIPASVLTLAAGAVFGLGLGLVVVSLASTTGAAFAFLIARYLAREKVRRMAEANDRFGAIDDAIAEGGWRIVAMLRLSPAVPFGLQNYLYGLTELRFWPYVLTSWIAMIPGTLMYVYLGHVAGAAAASEGRTPAEWALLVVGLLATIAVTVYITRLARRQLDRRAEVRDVEEESSEEGGASVAAALRMAAAAVVLLAFGVFAQSRSELLSEKVRGWVGGGAESAAEARSGPDEGRRGER